MQDKRIPAWVTIGGAAVGTVGCFMPWIKATAVLVGSVSRSGVDSSADGLLVIAGLVAAATVAVALLTQPELSRWAALGAVLTSLGALCLAVADLFQVFDRVDEFAALEVGVASAGSGIFVTVIGCAIAVVGSALMVALHRQPAAADVPQLV